MTKYLSGLGFILAGILLFNQNLLAQSCAADSDCSIGDCCAALECTPGGKCSENIKKEKDKK